MRFPPAAVSLRGRRVSGSVENESGCGGAAWIKFAGNARTGVGTGGDWRKRRRPTPVGFSEYQGVGEKLSECDTCWLEGGIAFLIK